MQCKQLTISLTCYQHCKCLCRVVQLVNTHHFHVAKVLRDHVHRLPERKQYSWREEGASGVHPSIYLRACMHCIDVALSCYKLKTMLLVFIMFIRKHVQDSTSV